MELRTNSAASSSSRTGPSSEITHLIQVQLPSWAIYEARLPISALYAEKSGGEWFFNILLIAPSGSSTCTRFPARDIKINGMCLDRFLGGLGLTGS